MASCREAAGTPALEERRSFLGLFLIPGIKDGKPVETAARALPQTIVERIKR